jgi:hypothetical protein
VRDKVRSVSETLRDAARIEPTRIRRRARGDEARSYNAAGAGVVHRMARRLEGRAFAWVEVAAPDRRLLADVAGNEDGRLTRFPSRITLVRELRALAARRRDGEAGGALRERRPRAGWKMRSFVAF